MNEFESFLETVKLGNPESFEKLYKPEYLNKKDDQGWYAIHYACHEDQQAILEHLISKNCNINQPGGQSGMRPIQVACYAEHDGIVEILTRAECDIEFEPERDPVIKIVEKYEDETIINILKARKFLLACKKGDLETVRSMLTDVNVEYCDKDNRRPIHWAVEGGHTEIVKLLLVHNCDIDALDKVNQAPEDIARNNRNDELIKVLDEERSERPLRRLISSMGVTCKGDTCDHKFCSETIRNKSFNGGEEIGKGSYGIVYKFQESGTERMFAVKEIKTDKANSIEADINKFQHRLNHERIIKYYGAVSDGIQQYIIMEYAINKSLDDKIKADPKHVNLNATRYSKQVLEGLEHLHKNGIIHRDLKPGNILLDANDNVKLADFGIGRVLERETGKDFTIGAGTHGFMAYEVQHKDENGYGPPADIWSLGATVLFMLTGKKLEKLENSVTPQMSKLLDLTKVPKEMVTFLEYMLDKDPKRRWTAEALLKLEMFRN